MKWFRILTCAVLSFALIPVTFVQAQNPAVTINIDANAGRHPISPMVYGLAYATTAQLNDLNVGVNRLGGNNTSRYNWQLNADNRGFDWYFESIAYSSATAGEGGDTFISTSRAGNAEPMVTIPTIGWVAKLGPNRGKLASFSIAKYGAQTGNDWQWFADAGNGIRSSGGNVTGNDFNDANVLVDSTFQQNWVQHIVSRFGTAASGGLKYYILDNEPSIWHSTHRDVHPDGANMEEIRNRMLDYGGKIKAIDPSALVVGPEEWGWSGYLFSGYDQQYGSRFGWSNLPDRAAHGGMDYLPWLLDQLRQANASSGQRILDVFTVHYYPQGGEFGNDTSQAMQLRRNRSTRSLWDPNYLDETWINDKVKLIPRIKGWVNTYYPGTKTGVTEYNWGAEGHINGATAQADILGIFGREGLDIAARWTTPDTSTPTYKAIKLYRNYDGNKSSFGDTSVSASVPNPDNLSAFGAVRTADGALTAMVVSKVLSGNTPVTVNLANFSSAGTAQVWQLTSSNTISRLSDITLSGSSLSISVPPQSITLLVIPKSSSTPNQPPTARISAAPMSGTAPLAVNFDGSSSSDADGSIVSYAWSYGDGSTGSGSTASHTFATAGNYTSTLTVTDNMGSSSSTSVGIVVNAPANQPPVARISATPMSGTAPLAVSFNGSTSSDPDGLITSYAWTFGDGSTGTGATTNHTYSSPGSYTATLTVTDNAFARSSTSVAINVNPPANQPPVARISATPLSGAAPLAVSFNGSASSDPDGTITAYAWSFGDGATGSGATVNHTYAGAGNYTATLTVTDNATARSSTSVGITVNPPPVNQPPVARMTASPQSGTAPLAVAFNGSTSSDADGTITGYNWTFGDGSSASGVSPSHTYANAGSFTATLRVTDNGGAQSSASMTITVNAPVVLNAPGALVATVSSRTVTLRWSDTSTGEEGFYIERKLKSIGTWARVGQVGANQTSFSETVSPGTYNYRVQSFNTTVGKVSAFSTKTTAKVR